MQVKEPVINIEVLNRTGFDDVAVHLVAERIAANHQLSADVSLVLATNIYVRQRNGWRLMAHHASLPAERTTMKESEELITTHNSPKTLQ